MVFKVYSQYSLKKNYYVNSFTTRKNLNGMEAIIMLRGGFERITLRLSNIEIRIIFLFQILKKTFVIYLQIIHLYHIGCVIFYTRCKKNQKNMQKKVICQAEMTWQFGRISGCIHLGDNMGKIHSACDVHAFHMRVTIQCGELKPTNSWFCYHVHQQLYSVCFICEVDGNTL